MTLEKNGFSIEDPANYVNGDLLIGDFRRRMHLKEVDSGEDVDWNVKTIDPESRCGSIIAMIVPGPRRGQNQVSRL